MTKVFLIVSLACNVWFLFMLLHDHIMETRLIRFFKKIVEVWKALGDSTKREEAARKEPSNMENDIIGKSRFKMASPRTTTAIPTQEAATSEKGIELT